MRPNCRLSHKFSKHDLILSVFIYSYVPSIDQLQVSTNFLIPTNIYPTQYIPIRTHPEHSTLSATSQPLPIRSPFNSNQYLLPYASNPKAQAPIPNPIQVNNAYEPNQYNANKNTFQKSNNVFNKNNTSKFQQKDRQYKDNKGYQNQNMTQTNAKFYANTAHVSLLG